jgi:hypothetical protein
MICMNSHRPLSGFVVLQRCSILAAFLFILSVIQVKRIPLCVLNCLTVYIHCPVYALGQVTHLNNVKKMPVPVPVRVNFMVHKMTPKQVFSDYFNSPNIFVTKTP